MNLRDLPIYELMVDDSELTGIDLLSIVKTPAIDVKGFCFSEQEEKLIEHRFYVDREEQKIVGPAVIPNYPIYRKDDNGDEYYVLIKDEQVIKLVNKFNSNGNNRRINFNHTDYMIDGYIEQNWVVKDKVYDKSRFYKYDLPINSWFVEVKIEDYNFWNLYVKGEDYTSFSIQGTLLQNPIPLNYKMNKIIDEFDINDISHLFK